MQKDARCQNKRPFEVLGHLSYNQVVEKLINCQEPRRAAFLEDRDLPSMG